MQHLQFLAQALQRQHEVIQRMLTDHDYFLQHFMVHQQEFIQVQQLYWVIMRTT